MITVLSLFGVFRRQPDVKALILSQLFKKITIMSPMTLNDTSK
jgi:hypothetical protein